MEIWLESSLCWLLNAMFDGGVGGWVDGGVIFFEDLLNVLFTLSKFYIILMSNKTRKSQFWFGGLEKAFAS